VKSSLRRPFKRSKRSSRVKVFQPTVNAVKTIKWKPFQNAREMAICLTREFDSDEIDESDSYHANDSICGKSSRSIDARPINVIICLVRTCLNLLHSLESARPFQFKLTGLHSIVADIVDVQPSRNRASDVLFSFHFVIFY
jgi:hypothetical protein